MANNADTKRDFTVGTDTVVGLGSFHKTLSHNEFGEVNQFAFKDLVDATEGTAAFADVPKSMPVAGETNAPLVNPQAGLAHDRLTQHPVGFDMPPAPTVLSISTAAEMTEIYWMAKLRDVSLDKFATDPLVATAAAEIHDKFALAVADTGDAGHLKTGVDVPGAEGTLAAITPQNVFRLGLPREEVGPLISQFFIRDINFGTQTIDQKERPYKTGKNYLTEFGSWLHAQKLETAMTVWRIITPMKLKRTIMKTKTKFVISRRCAIWRVS